MKKNQLQISRSLILILLLMFMAGLTACGPSIAKTDAAMFPVPAENTISFWGHSCCYLDIDGFGIITDPVFDKSMIIRRRKIPAPPPASYKNTQLILITHAHNDHLSTKTLELFPPDAVILGPAPTAKYLSKLDMKTEIMEPGDEYAIPGGRIVAVTAYHPGGKYSLNANSEGGALGYVIYTPYSTIYYSGDSDFFPGFGEVGQAHRPDISILNINGHLHSIEAVRAAWALRSSTVIPVHYGAYGYLLFGQYKKPRDYEEMVKLLDPILQLLEIGESMPLRGVR
jgi:L-ascorbate metabolism protein UlaG (beta-lactamase superfamily)